MNLEMETAAPIAVGNGDQKNAEAAPQYQKPRTAATASHRESDENYSRVVASLSDHWRVIVCKDCIQWILQFAKISRRGRFGGLKATTVTGTHSSASAPPLLAELTPTRWLSSKAFPG